MVNEIYDYHESGFRVFPLWGITGEGKCECGDENCHAVGKHPRISNWPSVPHWSDEQLDTICEYQVTTGFGVALDDHLIIDIDARNGGWDSYERLRHDTGIDFEHSSDFVVHTGGGGLHIYYSRPSGAFSGKLDSYAGIDFKSSGYVVGAGSTHASGIQYEYKKGFPDARLAQCPDVLLKMLEKKTHKRTLFEGSHIDVTFDEVAEIVNAIPNNDCHYDDFIQVGMAIHQALGSEGFQLWDAWAQRSDKYQPDQMAYKYFSFGKTSNPVTIGTLIYMAEQAGYVRPVTFQLDKAPEPVFKVGELPFDTSPYDPKRPPGFVGKLAAWMNGNAYSEPLEHLTTISAIAAVGNIIGLHTTDDVTSISTNLLVMCVAESASGKEMVGQSYAKIMEAAHLTGAMAGAIKSKQEICRNLIEHQAAYYLVDELGEVLRTIENAKKRGGAAYLEGVTGEIMSIFTKSSGAYHVSGDTRRDLVTIIRRDIQAIRNQVDKCEIDSTFGNAKIERLEEALHNIQTIGLVRPFLSLIGYSVPASLECIMTPEMAMNGFLSRALLAIEEKDNPKPRLNATGMQDLPETYKNTIRYLASTGNFDTAGANRIEFYGERRKIKSTTDARELLDKLRMWEWEYAEHHRETSGFTALIRRSFELISKISTILAAPEGVRTREHVEWAAMYVKRDLDRKIRHIQAAMAKESKDVDTIQTGIEGRIINLCDKESGEVQSVIVNKCKRKGISKDDILALIDDMAARGLLEIVPGRASRYRSL